jgi:hypothetical protein
VPMNRPCCGGAAHTGTALCDESIAGLTIIRCDCPEPPLANFAMLGCVLKAIDSTWTTHAEWNLKSKSNDVLSSSRYWPSALAKLNAILRDEAVSYCIGSHMTLQSHYQTLIAIQQPPVTDRLYSTSFFEGLRALDSKITPGLEAVQQAKAAEATASSTSSSSSLVRASDSGLLVNPSTVTVGKEGTSSGSVSTVARPAKKQRVVDPTPPPRVCLLLI